MIFPNIRTPSTIFEGDGWLVEEYFKMAYFLRPIFYPKMAYFCRRKKNVIYFKFLAYGGQYWASKSQFFYFESQILLASGGKF